MRRLDETPADPEITASLEAIDATLAGEAVDPRHAELAELALLLAAERPRPNPSFTSSLDAAVGRRFATVPTGGGTRPTRRRRWLWTPAAGLAVALVVAVVVVVSGGSVHGGSVHPTGSSSSANLPATSLPSASAGHAKAAAPAAAPSTATAAASSRATGTAPSPATSAPLPGGSIAPGQGAVLQPPANGRKIIQSAQLALSTAPSRVDTVAQEVFVVVGQAGGIVNSSTVTATGGPGGYAQFQLSIPSASLPQTMAGLSSLHYARVASRTDTTQDVNDQYQADVRRLADARALRTSLLRQLAGATTQAQIDSLTAQIHDAEASISSDEAALRSLNRQINYSQVTVTINGGAVPVPLPSTGSGGGFSLGQAAHDAGRVLTVAAGVVLIAGAALVPLALVAALVWWVAVAVRRRRREQALDLV